MRWTSRSEIFVWLDNIDSPGNVLTLGVNDVVERIYFYWRSCRCVCSVLSLDLASHPKDLYNLSPRILIGPTQLLKNFFSLHFKSAITYKHSERTMYLIHVFNSAWLKMDNILLNPRLFLLLRIFQSCEINKWYVFYSWIQHYLPYS